MSKEATSPLADGLFKYAEKLRFGFEDTKPDLVEALRLYKQAASLGHGRAHLRLGEMYEQAMGTEQDLKTAVRHYSRAAGINVSEGLAGIGGLLLRSGLFQEAERYWAEFFKRISQERMPDAWIDDRVFWAHRYLLLCFIHKQNPQLYAGLMRYRDLLVSYHQLSIEHATDSNKFEHHSQITDWISRNL
jgi:TPR repeat protein